MRVLAVANQKGGCGKTTTSVNLSASLSFLGKKVLLIDLDPQAHSTLGLGINPDELSLSVFDVLNPESSQPKSIQDVTRQVEKNLWLAPGQIVLTAIEQQLSGVPKREEKLITALGAVEKNYDFALIDCSPSLGILTFNALRAASEVIIPIEPSSFSVHGLDKINETIQMLKDQIHHALKVHALLTMYDNRKRFIRDIIDRVRGIYTDRVLRTVIRTNIRLREAASAGRPITRFDRHSTGFHDYLSLASEIIERGAKQREEDARAFQADERALDEMLARPSESVKKAWAETEEEIAALEEERQSLADEDEFGTRPSSKRDDEDDEYANLSTVSSDELEMQSARDELESSDAEEDATSEADEQWTAPEERLLEDIKRVVREDSEGPGGRSKGRSRDAESIDTADSTLIETETRRDPETARKDAEAQVISPLEVIKGIRKYPLKVSGGHLFICKSSRAHTVQIVGDFTNWVAVNLNSPGGRSGFWTRVFTLMPGRYKYKFIVDGEWVNDVNNPNFERNPYGGIDSVLDVGE